MPGSIALLAIVVGVIASVDAWRLHRPSPSSTIANIYARLEQHAQRIGVPTRASDTPNELAAKLIAHAEQPLAPYLFGSAGVAPDRDRVAEIRALAQMHVETRYGARTPNDTACHDALQLWSGLNRVPWQVWPRKQSQRFAKKR